MSDEFPAESDDHACPACRDGNHERCKRTMIYVGWNHPCECYRVKIKEHARLFHVEALHKMEQALRDDGYVVIPPTESLVIYQVQIVSTWYNGNTYGTHLSMEGAKAEAQSHLDEFVKIIDEDPEAKNSTEELMTRTLTWDDEEDWFKISGEKILTGHVAPFAWFAEGSAFKIVKVKIEQ